MLETIAQNVIKSYQGERNKDEKYHGKGSITFITDNMYIGDFENGRVEGNGVYTWKDGVEYKGEFMNDSIFGVGEYNWKNGTKYEGQVKDGLRHGYGIFEFHRGKMTFEGNWKNGKADGDGSCKFNLGARYTGQYKDGKKDGIGKMIYSSGNVYEGEWRDNVKSGQGTMLWVSKNESYSGTWLNGKPNGFGTYTWKINPLRDHQFPSHNIYTGYWLDGKRSGSGIFNYANGASYEGLWQNNLKHGEGKYTTDNGRFYHGVFANDQIIDEFSSFDNSTFRFLTLDIPFIFHLPDSACLGEDKETTLKKINTIVMRNINELRQLYHNYCVAGKPTTEKSEKNVLTRKTMWKLYIDSKINTDRRSLADLNRAYAKYFKDDKVFPERYQDPHNPATEFVFHDLLEHLLLISFYIYGDSKSLSVYEKGIAGGFSFFLKTHILNMNNVPLPLETSEYSSIFLEAEAANQEQILELFKQISHITKNSLVSAASDKVVSFREFSLMLKSCDFFSIYKKELTMKKLIPIFIEINSGVEESGSISLEYEMIVHDFAKAVSDCVILVLEPLISKIEKLKIKAAEARKVVLEVKFAPPTEKLQPIVPPVIESNATLTPVPPPPKKVVDAPRPRSGNRPASRKAKKEAPSGAISTAKEEPVIPNIPPPQAATEEIVNVPESLDNTMADCLLEVKTEVTSFYRKLFEGHKKLQQEIQFLEITTARTIRERALKDMMKKRL